MPLLSRCGTAAALLALLSGSHCALAQTISVLSPSSQPHAVKLSGSALKQIAASEAQKKALTSIQRKIDFNLFHAALLARPSTQSSTLRPDTFSMLKTIPISRSARPDANGMVRGGV